MDNRKLKGLRLDEGAVSRLSVSHVNVGLPIRLADELDADIPPTLFALSYWLLPRVPCIGEQLVIEAINRKAMVERLWWDPEGRAVVTLQTARLGPEAIEALERDGWDVAPFQDEPPSDWLSAK